MFFDMSGSVLLTIMSSDAVAIANAEQISNIELTKFIAYAYLMRCLL